MTPRRFTRYNSRILSLMVTAVSVSMISCSDEDLARSGYGRQISFEVSTGGGWSRATNDENSDGSLSTVMLKSGDNPLYLIPEVTTGVNVKTRKSVSRASAVTDATIADFGVYASTGNGATAYYMNNVEVTRANSWTPTKEYLWPGTGGLHINAYSPYCATSGAGEGITNLADADATVSPSLAYTVPAEVTDQTDLMWATPRDASSSPCALRFNHALSAVKFVTGAQMQPCTVKSITISGLAGSGKLSLEDGVWSDVTGNESYTANVDVALTSETSSEYVDEETAITDDAHTFMLIPQTLGEGATVTLTLETTDGVIEYTASLSGQTWSAGNTYTYHLSASSTLDRFVITVDSPLSFNYTGGEGSFTVKSVHEFIRGGVLNTSEVPWTAEFVDEGGNVVTTPSWITAMALKGDGSGDYSASTRMVEPTFIAISEPTRKLRAQPEVGSENAPYNLSNSTGASSVENTANCYVINAPGTYSIPLVYGNAIKNGADNTAAYVPTHSTAPFVNHLGNRIKHPYIYDNEGCSNIGGAKLIWEGRLNMIHDLHLSADGKSLVFDIPQAYIRQGNAVVALTDDKGTVMWSWQLWITDYVPGQDLTSMTYNSTNFEVMPCNMGYVNGGDEVDFASSTALVRFTQKPADGSEGKSVTVTIEQTGKHILTPSCYSFYQWGRKDPMISGIKEWYYADHTEITSIDTRTPNLSGGKVDDDFDAQCVRFPQVFWVVGSGEPTFHYTNNWNLGSGTRRVKTVYDPCPVGFMVPGNEMMALRDLSSDNFSYLPSSGTGSPAGFSVNTGSGTNLFFPALGYRSGNSGSETVTSSTGGSLTAIWTSHANTREGSALVLNYHDNITHQIPNDPRLEAFAVRPIKE